MNSFYIGLKMFGLTENLTKMWVRTYLLIFSEILFLDSRFLSQSKELISSPAHSVDLTIFFSVDFDPPSGLGILS